MTLDELLLEWSYRSERGYPSVDNPSDISILKQILEKLDLPIDEIISNLEEVRMIPSQLKGTITKGPFKSTNTGSDTIPKEKGKSITRLELLILKIENDEELELDSGSTIIVTNKEEVLDILPELVFKRQIEGFDQPQIDGVSYGDLHAYYIKAIQQLKSEIETLKSQIN